MQKISLKLDELMNQVHEYGWPTNLQWPSSEDQAMTSLPVRLVATAAIALVSAGTPAQSKAMKIRMTIDGQAITASLADNASSRDFASLLPLTLTLSDYAATEKVSDLPKRLSTKGAPAGYDPRQGDIAYYAPWGNLALFHKDFRYSEGLVKLGKLDSGAEVLTRAGTMRVTIELINAPRP